MNGDKRQPASLPTPDLTVFPRRKGGQLKKSKDCAPVIITQEVLQPCFGMPLIAAANKLGICATALKKVCRKLGIHKWPYKELKPSLSAGSIKDEWKDNENGKSAKLPGSSSQGSRAMQALQFPAPPVLDAERGPNPPLFSHASLGPPPLPPSNLSDRSLPAPWSLLSLSAPSLPYQPLTSALAGLPPSKPPSRGSSHSLPPSSAAAAMAAPSRPAHAAATVQGRPPVRVPGSAATRPPGVGKLSAFEQLARRMREEQGRRHNSTHTPTRTHIHTH
eukprot:CAMPEP_0202830796 /NCGR_PEP_ID=MMETSP1389-20130828/16406_1 /ASSEMBLY_ACC=CAM_ASM_000865 /TAXON_ID=302021 /ORGANISM="Rhodomonas sp., Strain CCMP768" /LENGTH=275 /DNA_ID=CAMNT_0049504467 /DNA_START=38 /DNA_END=862 /DNA_ORIENTATION=-